MGHLGLGGIKPELDLSEQEVIPLAEYTKACYRVREPLSQACCNHARYLNSLLQFTKHLFQHQHV